MHAASLNGSAVALVGARDDLSSPRVPSLPWCSSDQAAKFPAFYSREMLQARYEKYQIKVNEIYIPLAKNEEGKLRKNNRRFAFVELRSERDVVKALAIVSSTGFDYITSVFLCADSIHFSLQNPEKMGHVSVVRSCTLSAGPTRSAPTSVLDRD